MHCVACSCPVFVSRLCHRGQTRRFRHCSGASNIPRQILEMAIKRTFTFTLWSRNPSDLTPDNRTVMPLVILHFDLSQKAQKDITKFYCIPKKTKTFRLQLKPQKSKLLSVHTSRMSVFSEKSTTCTLQVPGGLWLC